MLFARLIVSLLAAVTAASKPATQPAQPPQTSQPEQERLPPRLREDTPISVRMYINESLDKARLEVVKAQEELKQMKLGVIDKNHNTSQVIKGKWHFHDEKKKQAEIDAKQVEIDRLDAASRSPEVFLRTGEVADLLRPSQPKLMDGEIGRVEKIRVVQVTGTRSMLAEIHYQYVRGVERSGIQDMAIGKADVWIEGVDTSNMVDDQNVVLDRVMEVDGTKHYDSRVGLRTVFLLKPIDLKQYLEPATTEPNTR